MLVFELRSALVTFAAAVAAVTGLELVGEEDGELIDDDGEPIAGHLYAVFTDQRALEELLSLWKRWTNSEQLDKEHSDWAKVFACLHDIRRWGPKDRVSAAHADVIRSAAENAAPGENVTLEVELVFRRGAAGQVTGQRARQEMRALGAQERRSARYEEFAYDALLVEVSPENALQIAERLDGSLAGLNDAFRIRPQSIGRGTAGEDSESALDRVNSLPSGDPVIAVLDGVPVVNHPYLAGRILLDDPDDLQSLAVGPRVHGTAMASLAIYGDLLERNSPVRRPIYVRPFLVDLDNFPNQSNERTLPDRLLADDLVRAVRRIKLGEDGQPPLAPAVTVINLSFGIPDLVFDGSMSPLARCLDWLSWQFGILFVVSAGNASEPILVTAFDDERAFATSSTSARTEAVLESLSGIHRVQRLLSPAESINALTVGALHDDAVGTAPTVGMSHDPFPEGRLPSLHSRLGPGFGRSTKPDILAPGGRLRVSTCPITRPAKLRRTLPPSRLGGLQVAGGMDPTSGAQITWSGATSGAAAVTTNTLHAIHDALEDAYGETFLSLADSHRALLLKTLLVHRARWPSEELDRVERIFGGGTKRHHTRQKADAARLFGFGLLDRDSAITCAASRATAWATGMVSADQARIFSMPLPEALIGQPILKSLTATVCWFTPTYPGRQAYKAVKLRIDEKEPGFGERMQGIGVTAAKQQLESTATRRGTVFHRRWEGRRAARFQAGDTVEIKVSRMPDDTGANADLVPFAVAVTVEADTDLPIYDQVLEKIEPALRPRIPQRVIV